MRLADLPPRIAEKIEPEPTTGCWLWVAGATQEGYGHTTYERRYVMAHRIVYELLREPIPEGLHIDHLCRVPRCVNPDHLEPVTCRENLLRGDTIPARHAAKTHCDNGHPFAGDNLIQLKRGGRGCRECLRAANHRHNEKRRGCHAS